MRLSVALLRNPEAEARAKEKAEKAEAPTVKTEEQQRKEDEIKAKLGATAKESRSSKPSNIISIWRRRFRPLPEAKAVDLFADVAGDTFVLSVAIGLVLYEWYRSSNKPDVHAEKLKELNAKFEELEKELEEREKEEKRQESRVLALEQALRGFNDPKTKKPLLPPAPTPEPINSPAA
jgi:hypothetical protein